MIPMSEERLAEIEDKWGGAVRDDLRELVAEVRRLREEVSWHALEREADDKRADTLRSQLATAREALAWYADVKNYGENGEAQWEIQPTEEDIAVMMQLSGRVGPVMKVDNGELARAALAKLEAPADGK